TRIQLKPGASQTVKMLIPRAHLCHWNEKTDGWDYELGEATLLIGSSSADIKLETTIKL
ncbi:MAG: fibronectin type III-like domain-contianing protein, partial [Bacteroidaceae bacterium]|nr:fibronectin type III-like domain-contianing protein [Bacteroidaceae bacterium]